MVIIIAFCEFFIKNLEKIPSNITIRFLFQPAEENLNGANKMIEGKCLENVEEIYGLHNITKFNLGEIGVCDGPIMAKVDVFEIIINAKGGHGSTPHLRWSPITIGSNIINALNQVTSQEIDSNERSVMTIGQFTSGNTYNVIPETGTIRGTIRTLTKGTSEKIIKRIYQIAEGQAKIYSSDVVVKFDEPGELTWNHPDPTNYARKAAEKYFTVKTEGLPVMASEDFAFYQKIIPGCFFMLGCGDEEHTAYLHTSVYDFNDKAIMTGVEMYIRILEEKFNLKLL
jgi:amidohydrolase